MTLQYPSAKAELDADAVSRGMGASTYVSSMKEREDDDVQSDISIMEAQYTATLAERIAAALEKYQSMSLQAQLQNAQYAYNAQTTAMNLASQWFNSYMNNAARAVKGSGGRGGKSGKQKYVHAGLCALRKRAERAGKINAV